MQRFLSIALALCIGLTMSIDAHAKRFGGGKSMGAAPTHQTQQMAPSSAGAGAGAAAAAAPGRAAGGASKWLGPLAGIAAGGLLAGQRAGLNIPGDCAVVGFGDYPFAEMLMPSLTTIKPPALEIGVLAATRILESLGGEPACHLTLLECNLIERESA